jgi:hypothetical protein
MDLGLKKEDIDFSPGKQIKASSGTLSSSVDEYKTIGRYSAISIRDFS